MAELTREQLDDLVWNYELPENDQPQEEVSKYRANRKKFFLTYPRCDKTPEEVYAHLSNISPIHKYLIARELHQDGAYHVHAYVEFVQKQDFKNSRWADIETYHPNDAGAVRNEMAVTKYCKKDGNFISNFYQLDPYMLAFQEEKTLEEALQIIKEAKPRDFALYADRIKKNLKSQKRRKITLPLPIIRLETWQREILDFLKGEPTPRRIIWIWSIQSSTGKTTFKKYVQATYPKTFLLGAMNLKDTMYSYTDQNIIWFDVPRQAPLDAEFTSQLETLSDGGIVNSTKYKTKNKIVSAHIVVTTNRPPPIDRLPNRIISFEAYITS